MHKLKKKKELGKNKAIHLNTHRHTYAGGEGEADMRLKSMPPTISSCFFTYYQMPQKCFISQHSTVFKNTAKVTLSKIIKEEE